MKNFKEKFLIGALLAISALVPIGSLSASEGSEPSIEKASIRFGVYAGPPSWYYYQPYYYGYYPQYYYGYPYYSYYPYGRAYPYYQW